jgi:3'5'-cyclic nucleotide phosphodiesterase
MEGNVHGALAAREHQSSSPASTDVQGMDGDESTSGERRLTRSYAAQALAVTLVDWERVGSEVAGGAPMSPQDSGGRTQHSQETNHIDLKTAVDRVSALFMVRLAAIWDAALTAQSEGEAPGDEDSSNGEDSGREDPLVRYYYSDFSTTTVCQQTLQSGAPWPFLGRRGSGGDDDDGRTLKASSSELERQVRQYIATILSRYNPDLPYHNYKHAYHVVLSVNKLLDLMLRRQDRDGSDPDASHVTVPPLFGLRRDAHLQLALLFAALVHDVDHKGVTNQQLVREANPLALRYNDTSVQENNSLTTAFQMLLEDEYALLRACMFPAIDDESANLVGSVPTSMDDGSFQRFRSLVINLVLSTDIASPERSQLGKSVFKEAFRPSTHRGADQAAGDGQVHNSSKRRNSATGRRGSLTSEISMPRIARNGNDRCHPRRRSSHTSACSIRSDVTSDSAARMMKGIGLSNAPGASPASNLPSPAKHTRRGSASSDYDSVAFLHRRAARTSRPRGPRRRLSNDTSVDSYWTRNGMDSIVMLKSGNKNIQKPTERTYTRKHSHHDSFSASSLDFTESASMLSSPSHSTGRVPCTFYSLSKQTSLLPSLAAMTPPDDQNPTRPRRCRISRRWSTEMSGQSLQQVGNHSIDMQNSSSRVGATNRTQVSRLVHEYYGYGDCGGGVGDGNSSLGESDDNDDNSSLSLTPPSSEDEMDGVVITGT